MDPGYLAIVTVLIAEVIIYVASRSPRFEKYLKEKGVTISPLVIMADLGRAPPFKFLTGRSKIRLLMLVAGLVSFVSLLILFYSILLPSALQVFRAVSEGGEATSPLVPVIPGVTVNLTTFIYIIGAASIAIALHEIFHAVAARLGGVKVESWGAGLLAIFPLAYVKINEESYSKAPLKVKSMVLTAGILANALLFLAAVSFTPVVMSSIELEGPQVVIVGIDLSDPKAPAVRASLPAPAVLIAINGTPIANITHLREYLQSIKDVNATLKLTLRKLTTLGGCRFLKSTYSTEEITVFKPAGRWRLGIYVAESYFVEPGVPDTLLVVACFLYWAQVVNISLGMINAAPLFITDGGKLIYEVLKHLRLERLNPLIQGATAVFTILLLSIGLLRFI